jgi:DNA-binding NarL/FixJ family response regulator
MIVEDSYVVRKALGKIMAGLGHTVVAEVADGAQAVSEYSNHQPDIVTMDLTMPGMSGAEATSQIIARFPAARIIVISASEEKQVVLDALERGARHYIIKPITPEKVAATIDNVLQQQFDQQKYRELIRKLKAADDFADGIENVLRARKTGQSASSLSTIRRWPGKACGRSSPRWAIPWRGKRGTGRRLLWNTPAVNPIS